MDNARMIWIEAQAGGPVTVTAPAHLYSTSYLADPPCERHFTRHPACPAEITDAAIMGAFIGHAQETINLDGTISHTWTLPVSAPIWTFSAPIVTALRTGLRHFLRELGPPDPIWQPTAFRALARRTTARHQRRNKARRHR